MGKPRAPPDPNPTILGYPAQRQSRRLRCPQPRIASWSSPSRRDEAAAEPGCGTRDRYGSRRAARLALVKARRIGVVSAALVSQWMPPPRYAREDIVAISDAVLARPDLRLTRTEDIIRIEALDLEWDIGMMRFEPADPAQVARGPDGRKIGIFLLHGGEGDYRAMAPIA